MLEQFDRAVFIVDQLSTSAKSPGRIRLRKVLGGLINEVGGGGEGEGLITGQFQNDSVSKQAA